MACVVRYATLSAATAAVTCGCYECFYVLLPSPLLLLLLLSVFMDFGNRLLEAANKHYEIKWVMLASGPTVL